MTGTFWIALYAAVLSTVGTFSGLWWAWHSWKRDHTTKVEVSMRMGITPWMGDVAEIISVEVHTRSSYPVRVASVTLLQEGTGIVPLLSSRGAQINQMIEREDKGSFIYQAADIRPVCDLDKPLKVQISAAGKDFVSPLVTLQRYPTNERLAFETQKAAPIPKDEGD